ncbi:MAG: 5-formyltetrahydrofolate cyclo-ligase [Gammaproteobacteria bacterium]|nr:5-formyltetrahydrofolate cyclo-ligase [Gammaproteobacteria bacterium]
MRARRRALSSATQLANSKAAAGHLIRWGIFLRYSSIALYLANDGELDPSQVASAGFKYRKTMYLPVLRHDNKKALWFIEYQPGEIMLKNRFGIKEPNISQQKRISPWGLDLILLPLVGFDQRGNRIGMGGGYYDRTLSFLNYRRHWRRPTLIGMAHECQRLSIVNTHSWDIPLDGVVSEAGLHLVDKKTK